MPIKLDDVDIALLESLLRDGRKSYNKISREINVSTPTVKARYDRLVNIGLIRAVTLDLDLEKLESMAAKKLENRKKIVQNNGLKIGKDLMIKISCDYCTGSVDGKTHVLKFGKFERFFCCTSCRSLYQEKYKTRIKSLE